MLALPSTPSPLSSNSSSTITPAAALLHLSHHKVNPGAAAFSGQQMDEWAPFRLALLLLVVASSVAVWVSYKLLCEGEKRDDVVYQPLNGVTPQQMRLAEEWAAEFGDDSSEDFVG